MVRLYIETNFLMSYASGRDPRATQLVTSCPTRVQRVLPACCIMEALSVLEARRKQHRQSLDTFRREAKEAERCHESPHSLKLAVHLRAAMISAEAAFEALDARLTETIDCFTDGTSVELLATRPRHYLGGLGVSSALDRTDQLILATILDDAAEHPGAKKALLTENRRCFFDDDDVRQAIIGAGLRYFASSEHFLQWYDAGGES